MPKVKLHLLIAAFFCLSIACRAQEPAPPLEFARLDLSDGRKLKKVIVKSYDTTTGKLLVVASGKAMTIPIALVPKPFQDALKSGARPAGDTTSAIPVTPARPPAKAVAVNPPKPTPMLPVEVAPAATPVAPDLSRIKNTALLRAQNYYRYEYPVGSGAVTVTAINFETDDPEIIVGWENRYRVQGRALLEYYDSPGRSFNRSTDRFEIILEQKSGQSLQAIDFTRK